MTAYTFPLLDIFWSVLMFLGLALVVIVIILCFIDNFSRRDHHGWAKAGWTVLILFVPLLGALIYIAARPPASRLERGSKSEKAGMEGGSGSVEYLSVDYLIVETGEE